MPPRLPQIPASLAARLQRAAPLLRTAGRGVLNLLLPPRCLACDDDMPDQGEIGLCSECLHKVAPEPGPQCGRCGAPLPGGVPQSDRCTACKRFSLHFDGVFPLGLYDGLLRKLVLKTKRPQAEILLHAIGKLLAKRTCGQLADFRPDAIVPVPMHWAKQLLRGANGPDRLAECLAEKLGIPVVRTIACSRYTSPQKDLLPDERFRNVRNAFRLRRFGRRQWSGARLVVVDDVLTTGATCSEIARVLKQAGAEAVRVAVAARATGM